MTGRLYYNKHRRKWQAIVECGKDARRSDARQIFRDARTQGRGPADPPEAPARVGGRHPRRAERNDAGGVPDLVA